MRLKGPLINIFLILLYISSLGYCYYIGRYDTIYGVGVISVIAIQIIGLIIFGFHFILTRYEFIKSLKVTAIVLIILQSSFISFHKITSYKPTYTISIPANYEGCVYMFSENSERGDVIINDEGIGYIGTKGHAKWKIKQGGGNITEAFSTSQSNEIIFHQENPKKMTAYYVMCLEINDSNIYPPRFSDYTIFPCLDEDEFTDWVNAGQIDETRLRKTVWTGSGNDDWKLDTTLSRL